jgi:lipoate-protein ligase A
VRLEVRASRRKLDARAGLGYTRFRPQRRNDVMRSLQLLDGALPGRPALDTAFSRALLESVARGELPESLRLYRPDDVLAFSLTDRRRRGFSRALDSARAGGFESILRLAGGHAAVFTRETLAFAWAVPSGNPGAGIHARFEAVATLVASALRRLGVDARVGPVPGEYCPGTYSVNARGRRKLMGVGQRVLRGGAHVGGVVVVGGSDRVRGILQPVYHELELELDPESVGSVEDEIGRISGEDVRCALLAEIQQRRAVAYEALPAQLFERAEALAREHRLTGPEPHASTRERAATAGPKRPQGE